MAAENVDLLRVLLQNAITPTLVLALIIVGVLVTKRQYDEAVRLGSQWQEMYLEERDQGRRDREAMREFSNTLTRVLDELYHLNGRRS